jgi:hypothetical protein
MHHGPNQSLITLIVIIAVLPLLYFRLRKMLRPQPLKLGQMWIRPAILVAVAALALFAPQPGTHVVPHLNAAQWSWLALAALLGAAAGWRWGQTMAIEVHPDDGTLMTKGNVAAMMVLVVLILFKLGLRPLLAAEGGALHLDALLITDASIVFSVALFTARSVEMWLRARAIMKSSRGA